MRKGITRALICIGLAGLPASALALATNASVERSAPDRVAVHWSAKGPVDLLMATMPDADAASATLVSKNDRDGQEAVSVDASKRPYFLLRDRSDGSVTRVAERLIPLQQGSNFRDIGGYPGAGGKHVRWGLIYRSGASAMLTPDDIARVRALGLRNIVDLRSSEERVLAPTRIDGVPYIAVGYSMAALIGPMREPGGAPDGAALYRNFPMLLAPQLRILFSTLLREEAPVEYNCSAGQDRTGFASAMILAALGVPRDVILKDYHLSTQYRQPAVEMPPIDTAAQANNPTAMLFARGQQHGVAKAQPLYDAGGKSLLLYALEEVDSRWGSVEAYLDKEVGVSSVDMAALRATYLE